MCRDGACAPRSRAVRVSPGARAVVSERLPEPDASIVAELRSAHVAQIRFRCGQTAVDAAGYAAIACAIASGHIHVSTEAASAGSACYSFTAAEGRARDTLYVGPSFDFHSLSKLALLVHECTHAIEDDQRHELTRGQAEAAAYVAQALYYRVRGTTWAACIREERAAAHVSLEFAGMDPLIAASDTIAARLHGSSGDRAMTAAEIEDMIRVIDGAYGRDGRAIYGGRTGDAVAFDGF